MDGSTSNLFPQVFVRKVIELHDKYMAYVTDSFANNSLFHKVNPAVYIWVVILFYLE